MSQMKALLEKLGEPLPEDIIRTKPGFTDRNGNEVQIRYLEWHTVVDILDAAHAEWQVEITEVGQINGQVFVRVALTIGGVRRENIGYEDSQTDSYGDPFSNAYAMAIKRAAALFGVGRSLYRSTLKMANSGSQEPYSEPSTETKKKTLATQKQRAAILNILEDTRLTTEEMDRLNILINDPELSRQKASEVLDYFLGQSQKQNGVWVKTTPGVLRSRKHSVAA